MGQATAATALVTGVTALATRRATMVAMGRATALAIVAVCIEGLPTEDFVAVSIGGLPTEVAVSIGELPTEDTVVVSIGGPTARVPPVSEHLIARASRQGRIVRAELFLG